MLNPSHVDYTTAIRLTGVPQRVTTQTVGAVAASAANCLAARSTWRSRALLQSTSRLVAVAEESRPLLSRLGLRLMVPAQLK